MGVALGLAVRSGVLRSVAIRGPAGSPTVVRFAADDLRGGETLTPHTDAMRAPLAELGALVARAQAAIDARAERHVQRIVEELVDEGTIVTVGVIVPRCPDVDDLRRRVAKARFATCADEHLVARSVISAAALLGVPVLAVSGAEALHRAKEAFDLDRQALGAQAKRAQPTLGDAFSYHHRLPTLAARVALAAISPSASAT